SRSGCAMNKAASAGSSTSTSMATTFVFSAVSIHPYKTATRSPSSLPSRGGDRNMATEPDQRIPAVLAARCGRAPAIPDLVGNTPLVEIRRLQTGVSPRVRIVAKLEGFNPGGSVKDRPAVWMVREGLRSGKLRPGKTIIDSTSGNTGIALALSGAALGYPVELVMPANVSVERKKIVAAYGAKVTFSDPLEGSDGAIRLCRKLIAETPDRFFKPDQYFNPVNPQAHFESTGPEIWTATEGALTHFVAGIGTGGTIMGTGRYL